MFTCRACTRRALTALLESPLPADANRLALRSCTASSPASSVRTYTTSAAAIKESIAGGLEERDDGDFKRKPKPKRALSKSTERAVSKRMEFMDDPFHIANEVQRVLSQDRFEEALLLTRNASAKYKTTVAWNHLIDHQMQNFKLHAAIKTYNEMKKRQQVPNAQTYTIIFRGCAKSPHPKLAVTEALRLYNNMMSSERLSPNTTHMNAVLQVCAKAEDIETMFTVIKSATSTTRAPNNFTYTTILNALRAVVDKPLSRDAITPDRTQEIKETVHRAKTIWEEVIRKWRDASLVIDEELVCAMGRILLLGTFFDNDAIFSLLEQTMGIPKTPEKLSSMAWKGLKEERASASDQQEDSAAPNTFAVTASEKGRPENHVLPGNNSLSLAMQAIENTGKTNLARRYWIVFTKNHGVVPDSYNWYTLLCALRRGKSSTKTAEYMAEMPKEMMTAKTFRIAMMTCMRDNLNKSAFNNATRILELMLTTMRIPDVAVLRNYLRASYANKRLFEEMAHTKDITLAKMAWGRQMCVALDNIWDPYHIAAKSLAHGGLGPVPAKEFPTEQEREAWVKEAGPRADLAALARKMIAAYDRLISQTMVPPAMAKRLALRRNNLNRFVVRYFEDRERLEPGWNRKVAELEAKKEAEEDWPESRAALY